MKKILIAVVVFSALFVSACSHKVDYLEPVMDGEVVENDGVLGPEESMDDEYVYFDDVAPVDPVELFAIVEDGVMTPDEFHVKKGDYVLLNIMNRSEEHAIVIPQYGWRTILHEDEETQFGFRARDRGVFPFHCSQYCLQSKNHIRGTIYVE